MKKIIITLIPIFIIAGGNQNRIDPYSKYDKNGYKNYSSNCKDVITSGLYEIKNKNLDYDKNDVFFKHQRITYVIPDKQNRYLKNCYKERSTGINEIDMKKLIKKLD